MSSLQPGKVSEANFGKFSLTMLNRLLFFSIFLFLWIWIRRRASEFKVCVSAGCTDDRKKACWLIVHRDALTIYYMHVRMNFVTPDFASFACEIKEDDRRGRYAMECDENDVV